MALLKLLQHGVATNDARLQEINVKGDEIIVESESRKGATSDNQRILLGFSGSGVLPGICSLK